MTWRLFGQLFNSDGKRSVKVKIQVHRPSPEGNWDTKISGSLSVPQFVEFRDGMARAGLPMLIESIPPDIR